MVGTTYRITSDEEKTIALYRAVGATTGHIVQIFTGFLAAFSLLIALTSSLLALIASAILTLVYSPLITANASALFGLPNPTPVVFIGFDWRITLVWLIIITIGAISLLPILRKLTGRNVIKDLRQ